MSQYRFKEWKNLRSRVTNSLPICMPRPGEYLYTYANSLSEFLSAGECAITKGYTPLGARVIIWAFSP